MGLRDKKNSDRKLSIQKETLRKLTPLSPDELDGAAGGLLENGGLLGGTVPGPLGVSRDTRLPQVC